MADARRRRGRVDDTWRRTNSDAREIEQRDSHKCGYPWSWVLWLWVLSMCVEHVCVPDVTRGVNLGGSAHTRRIGAMTTLAKSSQDTFWNGSLPGEGSRKGAYGCSPACLQAQGIRSLGYNDCNLSTVSTVGVTVSSDPSRLNISTQNISVFKLKLYTFDIDITQCYSTKISIQYRNMYINIEHSIELHIYIVI